MTKKNLQDWLKKATCKALVEFTIPWVAAESNHGYELALEWIESKDEDTATAGWATLSSLASIKPDAELDLGQLQKLLQRVQKSIHHQPDCVGYVMNGFVIAVGGCVTALSEYALQVAKEIGKVSVDMGNTACKVHFAPDSIEKIKKRGTVGKKRMSAKC